MNRESIVEYLNLDQEEAEKKFVHNGFLRQKRRSRISRKYDIYYQHWKDFDLLTCILLMIGLFVAVVDYEMNFAYPRKLKSQVTFVRVVVLILTILATFSLFIRQWLLGHWQDFMFPPELLDEVEQEHKHFTKRTEIKVEDYENTDTYRARKAEALEKKRA